MEDRLGSLGLVLNVVVLWTTRYIDAAVVQLCAEGHGIRNEDLARLSPLKHRNLNALGRYGFNASVPVVVEPGRCAIRKRPGSTTTRTVGRTDRAVGQRVNSTGSLPCVTRLFHRSLGLPVAALRNSAQYQSAPRSCLTRGTATPSGPV